MAMVSNEKLWALVLQYLVQPEVLPAQQTMTIFETLMLLLIIVLIPCTIGHQISGPRMSNFMSDNIRKRSIRR